MLLFNETIGIDNDVEQEWLHWIREVHFPSVLQTGLFADIKIYKVLHDQNEGTTSYSIQYFAQSLDNVQQYLERHAPRLVEEHRRKFLNRHVAFRTLLEEM
jgi:hypothetical protein